MKPLAVDPDKTFADQLFETLATGGVACSENAVNPEFLTRLRASLEDLIARKGARYFSIIRPHEKLGDAFAEMVALTNRRGYPDNLYRFWGYRTCHGNLP